MLPSWISCCRVGDMAVFLDVRRDRYMALAWEAALPLIENTPAQMPYCVARKAQALGWVDGLHSEHNPLVPPLPTPIELGQEFGVSACSPRLVAQTLWMLAATRFWLSTRTLERNLAAVSRRNHGIASGNAPDAAATNAEVPPAIAPVLRAFRAAERFALARDTCLLRALALQAALAHHNVATTVVFGVKLHPFEAHCWVQWGSQLLNDTMERAGLFVPIRVVH